MTRRTTNGIVRTTNGIVRTASFTSGLVAWWKYNAGSGSTATDSENSYDGTISGATWTTDAKTGGQALDFDGTDDYVSTGDIDFSSDNSYSVVAWFKTSNNSSFGVILSNYDNSKNEGTILTVTDQNGDGDYSPQLRHRDSNGNSDALEADGLYADGNWHHVVATKSGSGTSNMNLYIDGASVATTSIENDGAAGIGTAVNTHHGIYPDHSTGPYQGKLDDLRVYNDELTESEANTIYNNTK